MWKRYFTFIKLVPGRVVTHRFGTIDFSSDSIPLEKLKILYENDFPYLEITELGRTELYGGDSQELQTRNLENRQKKLLRERTKLLQNEKAKDKLTIF